MVIARSSSVDLRMSQPEQPEASRPIPMKADMMVHTPPRMLMPSQCNNRALPSGSTVKMKGSRNAVIVYFQAIMVVLYGFPPVMAAAANGDSAVGGDTSESSA